MTANRERGEVSVTLDGKDFVLRPSFTAAVEIEQMLGVGSVEVARRIEEWRFGLREAAAIITAGLKAAGEPASYNKVGEMVHKTGTIGLMPILHEYMTNLLTGGSEPGEAKAADQT